MAVMGTLAVALLIVALVYKLTSSAKTKGKEIEFTAKKAAAEEEGDQAGASQERKEALGSVSSARGRGRRDH